MVKSLRSFLYIYFFLKEFLLFFLLLFYFYFWLCWVFVSVQGLSLVAASRGHSSSRCAGLSLSRPLFLRSTGSRRAGSVVVAHGPSCSAACGIFPDQGSNLCPLHRQADSQPLRHQGSPSLPFLTPYHYIHHSLLNSQISIALKDLAYNILFSALTIFWLFNCCHIISSILIVVILLLYFVSFNYSLKTLCQKVYMP